MLGKSRAEKRNMITGATKYDTLEKIGFDFKGYFPVQYRGYRGFFLLSDEHSGYVYIYLVRNKREGVRALQQFYSDVVLYTDKVWSTLKVIMKRLIRHQKC
jgi:hypothetical protein